MVSRKGRTRGNQKGFRLPGNLTHSKPSTLWKIMTIIKDEGAGTYQDLIARMKLRWRYYPSPQSLYTILGKRTDIFVVVIDGGNGANVYDLKEEWKNVMD